MNLLTYLLMFAEVLVNREPKHLGTYLNENMLMKNRQETRNTTDKDAIRFQIQDETKPFRFTRTF